MASPSRSPRLLAARVGQVLVAPRAALARVDAEGGGLGAALWLVALGAVTFRLPQLAEALLGLTAPAPLPEMLGRVGAVLWNELVVAAWVVVPAAVIVTALAGARRDPSLDVELGAACYVPYFVVRGAARAFDAVAVAVAGAPPLPSLASELPAAAAVLLVLVPAVSVARARAARSPAERPTPLPPGRAALGAGLGLLALAAVGLGGNAVWAARHLDRLRPMSAGQLAPDFSLPRADGAAGSLSLAELRGQVVVLDFWATWCSPCLEMIPVLHDLHREWAPRGVAFVGIDSDGGEDAADLVRAFLRAHPAPYPMVVDDGRVNALYNVPALPRLVVIGRDGRVRRTFLGRTDRDTIARSLGDAVGGGGL